MNKNVWRKIKYTSSILTSVAILPLVAMACSDNSNAQIEKLKTELMTFKTTNLSSYSFNTKLIEADTSFDHFLIGVPAVVIDTNIVVKIQKASNSNAVTYTITSRTKASAKAEFTVEFEKSSDDEDNINTLISELSKNQTTLKSGKDFQQIVLSNSSFDSSNAMSLVGIVFPSGVNQMGLTIKANKTQNSNAITYDVNYSHNLSVAKSTTVTFNSSTVDQGKLVNITNALSAMRTTSLSRQAFLAKVFDQTTITSANASTNLGITLPDGAIEEGLAIKVTKVANSKQVNLNVNFNYGLSTERNIVMEFLYSESEKTNVETAVANLLNFTTSTLTRVAFSNIAIANEELSTAKTKLGIDTTNFPTGVTIYVSKVSDSTTITYHVSADMAETVNTQVNFMTFA